ncbi:Mitochondrial import inner membrane translocase subunit tim8 [Apophysomyces ossiformis]|uniref:Mitochondrial import inner membrane translocase subunit n=1 Tax=Apophysomyces ossiformis TaxID=679940 RepID=A0A8H7BXP3_9FUNG|nr:Mitochondrial import inner membrane translocase subunit tim8 [Apophysomyces ossiformis]
MSQQQPPFTESERRELSQFFESENAKARIQETVHRLTDMCWDKCIFKVSNKMDRSDEACLSNCVERFLDSSIFIVKRLESLRNSGV